MRLLACAVAVACLLPAQAQERSAAASPERLVLLREAEAALASGRTIAAIGALDRAALMLHTGDTEMGLVRAWLQLGDYRRALAFAAHTAGAHRDTPAAAALYVWLLAAGGQTAFAQRVLEETRQRLPDDVLLRELATRLQTPPAAAFVAPPALMADDQPSPAASANVVASGVLLDEHRAVVPLSAIRDVSSLWVRNGLGRTTAARVERRIEAHGVAMLGLAAPLDDPRLQLAPRDPFAGSPGFVVAYAPSAGPSPAWPWLYQGFFGAPHRQTLGIDVPAHTNGAPVLDAAGRWAGMVVEGRWVAGSLLRELVQGDPTADASRIAPDEAYERALRIAVQVVGGTEPRHHPAEGDRHGTRMPRRRE